MKKTVLTLMILVTLSFAAAAQNYKSAIGLRGGEPSGITFKTFINRTNAVELIAGTGYWGNAFAVTGYYLWQKPTDWAPGIDWFAGPGAHLGARSRSDDHGGFLLGLDGIIGLEYTFDEIPLNLAFGVGPSFQLAGAPSWSYWNGGFSIRYVF